MSAAGRSSTRRWRGSPGRTPTRPSATTPRWWPPSPPAGCPPSTGSDASPGTGQRPGRRGGIAGGALTEPALDEVDPVRAPRLALEGCELRDERSQVLAAAAAGQREVRPVGAV